MESCAGAHCPLLDAAGTHQLLGNATRVNKTSGASGDKHGDTILKASAVSDAPSTAVFPSV